MARTSPTRLPVPDTPQSPEKSDDVHGAPETPV
jgi:hypothetical protein